MRKYYGSMYFNSQLIEEVQATKTNNAHAMSKNEKIIKKRRL